MQPWCLTFFQSGDSPLKLLDATEEFDYVLFGVCLIFSSVVSMAMSCDGESDSNGKSAHHFSFSIRL